METQAESFSGGGDDVTAVKDLRQQLESRIESRHKEHEELLTSVQTLVPDLYSSLNISLHLLSTFHRRPYTPLIPPPTAEPAARPLKKPHLHHPTLAPPPLSKKPLFKSNERFNDATGNGTPMSLLRSMVAVCLLERVPFEPIDSSMVLRKLENDTKATAAEKAALRDLGGDVGAIEAAMRSIAEDNGGAELVEDNVVSGKSGLMVMSIDRSRLVRELLETQSANGRRQQFLDSPSPSHSISEAGKPPLSGMGWGIEQPMMYTGGGGGRGRGFVGMMPHHHRPPFGPPRNVVDVKTKTEEDVMKDVEVMVNKPSFKETLKSEAGKEIYDILTLPTALEMRAAERFKTKGGPQLQHYCTFLTKDDCRGKRKSFVACEKVHFRRIVSNHTEAELGDCSFLDTCRHMKTCKYVHYELDSTPDVSPMSALAPPKPLKTQRAEYCSEQELGESQWINCDIRNFRMDILGQFGVIMADPPWDIHMELPYGTMADDEMRTLNVPALQTDGLIFLWVTGRAMELGRECLELWGYKRVEEIIWVKTNQLQRIIRTGRTGHWLNHSKEHCLVGIKGNPIVNRNIDTDVVVAEVRETSRKPDEMYSLLERISPRTRKLELFARMHNTQSGWLSLGNQLSGARLVDDGLRARFKAAYPDVEVQPPSPPRSSAMEIEPGVAEARTPFSGPETSSVPPQVTQAPGNNVSEGKPFQSLDIEIAS